MKVLKDQNKKMINKEDIINKLREKIQDENEIGNIIRNVEAIEKLLKDGDNNAKYKKVLNESDEFLYKCYFKKNSKIKIPGNDVSKKLKNFKL